MIGAAAMVGALVFAGVGPGLPIPAAAFGQHIGGIAQSAPADIQLTSVRLWDAGVRWDQIETARDQYDWTALDAAVDNARAAGATDILYVLGSTPRWAARNPDLPGLYGPGSTSLPADPEDYLDFVREVAQRYKGRITAYQIWNEANTRSFYEGDWTALAQLTRRAHDAIKITDPSALVVAASSTVIPDDLFATESFFVRYARALHKAGDPVDAMAVHLYPVDTTKGPDARVASIRAAQRVLNKVGIDRPLWDTEVNYGDRRAGYAADRAGPGHRRHLRGPDLPGQRDARRGPHLLVRLGPVGAGYRHDRRRRDHPCRPGVPHRAGLADGCPAGGLPGSGRAAALPLHGRRRPRLHGDLGRGVGRCHRPAGVPGGRGMHGGGRDLVVDQQPVLLRQG